MQGAVAGDDPPAFGARAAQFGDGRVGDDLAAARADRVGDGEREAADAALDAHEDRAGLLVGRRLGLDLADRLRQGGVGLRGLEQLRNGRAHRDAVGVARVHPAQEGLDEPVDDFTAEALGDVRAHRHVVADLGAGQVGVALDAGQALLGEDAFEGGGGAGDAHDVALGHGAQGAAGPDRGGGGGGRLEAVGEAGLAGQGDGLGSARQHRLRAEVHARAGDLAGQQLAADAAGRLQDGHPRPALQQPVGRGQSRDPGSDDDDVSRRT